MAKVGKTVAVAGAAIAAAATAIAVESVKSAVSFQASMEKIHTQAGASQKDVESLTRSVLKLAPATQQGPQALAEALYHLKSLGMGNAAAMRALAQASSLAAAGGSDLEDTATAIGAAWRSGIKGGQSFSQVAGTVNAIIGAGNMKMQDFVQSLSSGILPAARTFGVSLKSVGSALALMTDEGIPAEDAATRLRMSLSLLGAPSVTAQKQLAKIGLTSTSLASAMRGPQGLIGAISLLKTHLDNSGLSAVQSAALISNAFGGGRSSSAIMTMLNNLAVLERKQKQVNATTGDYGAAVAAQRQTAQAQFATLRSSIDTLGVRLGLDLLPPLTSFVKFLAVTALPAVEQFAGKVAGILPVHAIEQDAAKLTDIIKGLFGIHGKPEPVTMPVKLGGLRPQQFGALMGQMGARSPLTVPVTLAVTGIRSQQLNAVLGQQFTAFGGSMSASLITDIESALRKVNWGSILSDVIKGAVSGAQQIGAAFLALLGKINWISMESEFATIAIGLALGLVNNLVPALISTAVHHPLDMLSFLLALIPIGRAAGILVKIFGKIPLLGTLTKWFLGPVEKLGGIMETALGGVLKKVFGPVGSKIGSYFSGAKNWLFGKGETVILGLWYGAEDAWGTVTRWLGKLAGKTLGALGKAGSWLYGAGKDVIGGLLSGIKDALSDIGHWVKTEIVDPIINWVKSWFGIHSPSTVMAGIGGHLMGGLFKGMMSHDLGGMVKKIFGSMPEALLHIAEKGLIGMAGLPLKAVHALAGLGKDALGLLGKGLGAVFGTTQFNWTEMIGQAMAAQMGWTGANWTALQALWQRESGWNPAATNPTSGAYGIPQALPASKMASAGPDWLTNPVTQIRWGLGYIAGRYGSPLAAWGHEQAFSWYGHGGPFKAGQAVGVGERGPELAVFNQPGTILSPETTAALAAAASGKSSGIYGYLGHLITQGLTGSVVSTVASAEAAAVRLAARVRAAFAAGQITGGEESSLLDRISRDIDSKGSRLVRTMTRIGLQMRAGLLGALEGAQTAAQARSAVSKLVSYVEQAWSAGDITAGRASQLTDFLERDSTRLQALATRRARIAATIKAADSYAASTASSAEQFAGLSGIASGTGTLTQGAILAGLRNDLATINRFDRDVRQLAKLGLRKDLLNQIIQMGPSDGVAVAEALLNGPVSVLREINATQAGIARGSTALGRTAADAMYDSGKQAGKGFLSGLEAQEKAITKLMDKLAKSMIDTIRKALGIKSPSTVMAHHGMMTALGVARGLEAAIPRVSAASGALAGAAAGGLLAFSGHRLAFPAGAAPALSAAERQAMASAAARGRDGGEFTGTLYLEGGALLGVVKGVLREHDRELVRAANAGTGLAG